MMNDEVIKFTDGFKKGMICWLLECRVTLTAVPTYERRWKSNEKRAHNKEAFTSRCAFFLINTITGKKISQAHTKIWQICARDQRTVSFKNYVWKS